MENPQQFFIRLILFLVCCLYFQKLFHQLQQCWLTSSILFTILCICINICLSHVNLRDSPSLSSSLFPILVHGSRQLIDLNKLSKWPHLAPRRVLPTHTHTRKHSCNVIAGARYTHTHMRTTSVKRCVSGRQRIQLNAAQAIKAADSRQQQQPQTTVRYLLKQTKAKDTLKKKPS